MDINEQNIINSHVAHMRKHELSISTIDMGLYEVEDMMDEGNDILRSLSGLDSQRDIIMAGMRSAPVSRTSFSEDLKKTSLYKTELCRSFEETGICKYSNKCQFAHGRDELRIIARHPRYKTEICKTFHNLGTCPYGKRCRFIHTVNVNHNGDNISDNPSSSDIESDSDTTMKDVKKVSHVRRENIEFNDQQQQQQQQQHQEELIEKLLVEEPILTPILTFIEPILAVPIPMDIECPPISPDFVHYVTRPRSKSWSVSDSMVFKSSTSPFDFIHTAAAAKKKRLPIFEQINSDQENSDSLSSDETPPAVPIHA